MSGRTQLRGHQHDLAQHPVDKARRVVGRQLLGQLDGLVDDHRLRHIRRVEQLPYRDAQNGAIHGGQPVQRPAPQMRGDQVVDVGGVFTDPSSHRGRVRM